MRSKHAVPHARRNAVVLDAEGRNEQPCREPTMKLHLSNADVVAVIALALIGALLLAIRFRPSTWKGILAEAVAANVVAIGTVVALEMLLA
jgi:hypothetical protein